MILTCPDCATSYFVDDGSVPAQGRSVKCSNCSARWRAFPQAEPEPEPEVEFVAPIAEASSEVMAEAEPDAEAPALAEPDPLLDDLEVVEAPVRPRRVSAPPAAKRSMRGPAFAGLGVAAVLAVTAGAVMYRNEVVRMVPAAEPAFAALGVRTDPLGLEIEQVKFQATFQGGRPVLAITGAIHNVRDHTISAPPLRVTLLDKEGRPLAAKLARPLNAAIPPGGKRYFALNIADPPAGMDDPRIEFDAAARVADAHEPAEAVLTPEPPEAKPLPPGSPDALPTHG
jgi:predicted Zn finger-like uncharacterized protein